MGFDHTVAEDKQQYNEEMTWQEYFASLAEERMLEVATLNEMAKEEGYDFLNDVWNLKETENGRVGRGSFRRGISDLDDYLVSYYSHGMTREIFEEQLLLEIKADAYKTELQKNQEVTQTELENIYQLIQDGKNC